MAAKLEAVARLKCIACRAQKLAVSAVTIAIWVAQQLLNQESDVSTLQTQEMGAPDNSEFRHVYPHSLCLTQLNQRDLQGRNFAESSFRHSDTTAKSWGLLASFCTSSCGSSPASADRQIDISTDFWIDLWADQPHCAKSERHTASSPEKLRSSC